MNKFNMPKLMIGSKSAEYPILQGGMGVAVSLSGLASAVANAGGIGIIAANAIGMIEPDYFENSLKANIRALRTEIRRARELTDGIIGVNLMIAANDFTPQMQVILEEKPDIIFIGAGLPIKGVPVKELRAADIMIVPIVSSDRAVKLIFKSWQKKFNDLPDAVVVEGPLAGGHLGFSKDKINHPDSKLEVIIPKVVKMVKTFSEKSDKDIPVIAAGGIFSGADIEQFLKLGADGVQIGTRFIATDECDADISFKEAFVNSRKEDLVIVDSPVGMPGRAINNHFLNNISTLGSKLAKCPWKCLESCDIENAGYCLSIALNNARIGKLDEGYAFAGASAYKVKEIIPVKKLIEQINNEYSAALNN